MADIKVGEITHYYEKIGVAVLKVSEASLKVGETIKVTDKESNERFTQEVASMQIEHKSIPEAKVGEEVGLKVEQEVKEGDFVYKVTA